MSCILCDQSNFKTVSTKDAKSSDFLNVSICQSCGMVQQDPIPTEAELKAYYSTEYRQDYKNTYTPKPKHIFRAGNLALERIKFLWRCIQRQVARCGRRRWRIYLSFRADGF